jgi:cell division septation protein DedD
VVSTIKLPAEPRALRMDPLGRVLLVQAATDSVYLIDIGTSTLVGAARTAWRGDLPLVLPDGAVALANGDTVTLISSIDLGEIRSLPTGARDTWFAMRWNGFRPRAAGLDQPVRFREGTGGRAPAPDSQRSSGDSTSLVTDTANAAADVRADSGAADVTPPRARARTAVFTVQYAAVLTEALAREATVGINVDGRTPRIATSVRDGRTMYRVVMGPFTSREEAERVGKASGRSYWVFEGAP